MTRKNSIESFNVYVLPHRYVRKAQHLPVMSINAVVSGTTSSLPDGHIGGSGTEWLELTLALS